MSDLVQFLGGLLQGFNQDQQFRQQQAALDDYKKQMAKKVQMEIDEQAKKDEAIDRITKGNASSIDYIRAGIKPQDRLIMDLLSGGEQQPPTETTPGIPEMPQGVFQGENPLGIPQEMRPQVTFGGDLTGVPKMPSINGAIPGTGGLTREDIIRHNLAGAAPLGDTVRSVTTTDKTGRPIVAPMTRGGTTLIDKGVPAPEQWETVVEKDAEGIPRAYHFPKRPQLGVSPNSGQQPQQQRNFQLSLDTTQPGWQDQAKAAIDAFQGPQSPKGPATKTEILLNTPIGDDAMLWLNNKGESPAIGTKTGDAQSQGFKKFDPTMRDKIIAKNDVIRELEKFYPLMEKVYGPEAIAKKNSWRGNFRRIQDYATALGAAFKTDPDAAELRSFWTSSLPQNLKNKGQVGSLSDRDVAMGAESQPDFSATNPDTPDLAWRKYRNLIDYYEAGKQNLFQGKGESSKNKPSIPSMGNPKKNTSSLMTPENIAFTAKKYNITEDEVRKRLGGR